MLGPNRGAIATLVIVVLVGVAAAAPQPVQALQRPGAIVVDGQLDHAEWGELAVHGGFVQRFPRDGAPPTQNTEFRVAYDEAALYVAVRAFDDRPDAIRGLLTRRDLESSSDWIVVGVDSHHDRRTAYMFAVNPAEVQRDYMVFDDTQLLETWDAIWSVRARVDDQGWTAEFRIPLSQLRFDEDVTHQWGLQVIRSVARTGEQSSWSAWPQHGSQIVSRFGDVHVAGISSGLRLEIVPYASGAIRLSEQEPTESRVDGGLDLAYGLSSAFTLAATINPDFGEVEADPSEINLSGQETLLAENRPFFVQAGDLLRHVLDDSGPPGEGLFYSRRIRTIHGAAKLTGKTGNQLSLGMLAAVTAAEVDRPITNHGLVRIAKDLRAGKTQVSATLGAVHRQLEDSMHIAKLHDHAISGGVAVTHRFGDDDWATDVRLTGSRVHGSTLAILDDQRALRRLYQRPDATHVSLDPTRTSLAGVGAAWNVGRWNHERWNFGTGGSLRTPGLELNDLGYQRDADTASSWLWFGYRDDDPSEHVMQWTAETDVRAVSDTEPMLHSVRYNAASKVTFVNHWSVDGGANYTSGFWNVAALRGGPRLRGEDATRSWLHLATDPRVRLSADVQATFEHRIESGSYRASVGAELGLQPRSNIEAKVGWSYLRAAEDHQYLATVIDPDGRPRYLLARLDQHVTSLTLRLAWTLSPRLSVQLYAAPFFGTGRHAAYKEAADTYAASYEHRFRTYLADQVMIGSDVAIDHDDDGVVDHRIEQPDFTVQELRSNLIVRWEYLPGSTWFVIWSHARDDEPGAHTLLMKLSYRLDL